MKNLRDEKLEISAVLSLLEHDENVMSDVQKEILEEEITELPPIKEGEINVTGIYAYDMGEKVEVKVYIRNGLKQKVSFGKAPLVILNSKEKVLAYQIFNLESLGELPPGSARPLKIYFEKKNLYVDKISLDDWRIAFDTRLDVIRNVTVQYENLPQEIEVEDKLVFDKFLNGLPQLKEGEFTVSPFSIGVEKGGNILVTVVMRNGNSDPITLQKMPMTIKDANGNVVKSTLLDLGNFTVGPFKARICNVAFPTNVEVENSVALNDWAVSFNLEKIAE